MTRREMIFGAAAGGGFFTLRKAEPLKPIVIGVNALLDQGAHSGKGLNEGEIASFMRYQERARREYSISGIRFDVQIIHGAYLRTQGYSEIPDRFLARKAINLFVSETLGYDIDTDRSGGCSIGPSTGGPHPRGPRSPGDPYYKIFLGLKDAGETTLRHEYAHHFTLDTLRNPTIASNVWADLRNEYWLWRQSRGIPILQFRACAHAEWAEV
jgi:hypothetical protein